MRNSTSLFTSPHPPNTQKKKKMQQYKIGNPPYTEENYF